MSNIYIAGVGLTKNQQHIDYPRPDRLMSGNPKRITTSAYTHPNMDCGIWQCEVGAWNIVFAQNKQEFFNIIEGIVRIHNAEHDAFIEVKAGEAGVIPPGFVGTFEVVETVTKYFVVVEI